MISKKTLLFSALTALTAVPATASSEGLSEAAKNYSPYADTTQATNVYWGDSHLHTGFSLDAGLFGNTLVPDDAYRFARGEELISSTGIPVKLARPLDWMVLTDHTDLMGIAADIQSGTPNILADKKGNEQRLQLTLMLEDEQQLMFCNHAGLKALMMDYRDFAQMLDSGKARLLLSGSAYSRSLAEVAGIESVESLHQLTGAPAQPEAAASPWSPGGHR